MSQIKGIEGIDGQELQRELENGAKFRMYQYTFSMIIMTFKRPSDIYFIRAGHSSLAPGLKYSLLSAVVGWWGLPWGLFYTPWAIISNMTGGIDVTGAVIQEMTGAVDRST
jgi:hypothetical protein